MIRIGYPCINTTLPAPNRTCRLKNATSQKILELASANIEALRAILAWNAAHGLDVFRISSDVIPLASHPVNKVPWWQTLQPQLEKIGSFIRDKRLRVSMHPGQFTVLNSPRRQVIENSVRELEYHATLLDALGVDARHKVVIHLGGVYGDKGTSLARFIDVARDLCPRIKSRLVIENDERCYTVADALRASKAVGLPVVFDVFHHAWNPALQPRGMRAIILLVAKTWHCRDGRVKIHYSNQWPGKPPGTHSKSINVSKFLRFYDTVKDLDIDIMLEVKDKQRSALRLLRALGAGCEPPEFR